jgi:hypothetical protein
MPPGKDTAIRCPRLGHQIEFEFCRQENQGLPCFKILDCWFEYFDVKEYLEKELTPEEWDQVFNRPPKQKIQSLLELIEEAKSKNK